MTLLQDWPYLKAFQSVSLLEMSSNLSELNNTVRPQFAGVDFHLFQETYDWVIGILLFVLLILSYHLFKKSGSRLLEFTSNKNSSLPNYLKPELIEEKSPLLFIVIDKYGVIKKASNDWLTNLGYLKNDVVGKHFSSFLFKQKTKSINLENLISDQESIPAVVRNTRFYHQSGSIVDFNLSRITLKDRKRGNVHSMVIFEDVTERLKTDTELQYLQQLCKDQEKELKLLYHRSNGIHAVVDRQFIYKKISPQYASLLGIKSETLIDKAIDENGPLHADQLKNDLQAVFETGSPISNTVFIKNQTHCDNCNSWIVHYDPIGSEKMPPDHVLISFQCDHVKKDTSELSAIVGKVQDHQESPSSNDAIIDCGHEIKTPLNGILGFTQIAINQTQSDLSADVILQTLYRIKQSGQDLSELISKFVDRSKAVPDQLIILSKPTDLQGLIQGIFDLTRSNSKLGETDFTYRIDPLLPDTIHIDKDRLDQIILFVINNAFQNVSQNGSVMLDVLKNNHWLQFKFSGKEGVFNEEVIALLLKRDTTADASSFKETKNIDESILTVKNYINLLDGCFTMDQNEKGRSLNIQIPLVETGVKKKQPLPLVSDLKTRKKVVLLVEDNLMNQDLMVSFFRDYPFEIQIANDGEEGVFKTRELKPDLVLMDIHMPIMNGLEAVTEIRKDDRLRNIPIIALSADDRKEKQAEAFEAGFDGYLPKPFDFDDLIPYLERYIKIENGQPAPAPPPDKLPQDILKKLTKEVRQLKSTPRDFASDLLNQIEAIRSLLLPHQSNGVAELKTLQEMENAVFECDNEKLDQLLGVLSSGLSD